MTDETQIRATSTRYETGGFVPVVPGPRPFETAASFHARTGDEQYAERQWESPGPPPWAGRWDSSDGGRLRRWSPFLIVLGLMLIVAGVFGAVAQRTNALPQWVPLIGKDTGVAACEAIANQGSLTGAATGKGSKSSLTTVEYREMRAVFEDSRYPEIRDNGTRLMDYAWQLQGMTRDADNAIAGLALVQPMTEAYTGLAGGCADHGYTIPALGS
jgi:hypothetical protein